LAAVARRSTGSMRDAISLLDQLLSYGEKTLDLDRVEHVLGLVNPQTIGQLVTAIAEHDAAAGLALINRLVADGVELGQLVDQIVAYLRAVLFVRMTGAPDVLDVSSDVAGAVVELAESMAPAAILASVREFIEARGALRDQVPGVPQLPLEIAFLRSALPEAVPSVQKAVPAAPAPVSVPDPKRSPKPTPASAPVASHPKPQLDADRKAPVGGADPVDSAAASLLPAAQAAWDQFLVLAGKQCGMKVQAALRSVRELDAVGETLVLQFGHAFSRDLVVEAENLSQVESLWENLLNRRIPIRCTVAGESLPTASAAAQPAKSKQNDDESLLDSARELGAVVKRLS
jgi:DNA polymerase III subunit gamma/tau